AHPRPAAADCGRARRDGRRRHARSAGDGRSRYGLRTARRQTYRRMIPLLGVTGSLRRSHQFNKRLVMLVVALLLIAAARTMRLTTFEMHHDEVWSVWQTFGTPAQIIDWTPFDWA